MYPHERSLVEKYKDQPFVILGVNSDRDREALKKTLVEERITWRSWFDGGSASGPIATAWNVTGWPTVYIIDAKGMIRFKDPRGAGLDEAVEELLAELRNN